MRGSLESSTDPETSCQGELVATRHRSLRLKISAPIETAFNSVQQVKRPKRPRERYKVPLSRASPEPASKRVRISPASAGESDRWKTISEARVESWRENAAWPTEEQETTMDSFRDIVNHALASKRSSASLSRKRSNVVLLRKQLRHRHRATNNHGIRRLLHIYIHCTKLNSGRLITFAPTHIKHGKVFLCLKRVRIVCDFLMTAL